VTALMKKPEVNR